MSELRLESRPWARSARGALVHLIFSAAVIALVAAMVFWVWFPPPYGHMLGGGRLFLLIACVDVTVGPLLTLVIFDVRKPRQTLIRDLTAIGVIQLAALCFGAWTMFEGRPVHLVFEVDLFRVVTRAQVNDRQLLQAQEPLKQLPLGRPSMIGVLKPTGENLVEATLLGIGGVHLAYQPKYWLPFDAVRGQVWKKARPLDQLALRSHADREALTNALQKANAAAREIRWLPVLSDRSSWIALVTEAGEPIAFADIDSY